MHAQTHFHCCCHGSTLYIHQSIPHFSNKCDIFIGNIRNFNSMSQLTHWDYSPMRENRFCVFFFICIEIFWRKNIVGNVWFGVNYNRNVVIMSDKCFGVLCKSSAKNDHFQRTYVYIAQFSVMKYKIINFFVKKRSNCGFALELFIALCVKLT